MDVYWGMMPQRKKQKTTKKPKASNWFEKCTVDQLKQLCKASLLPVSGAKNVIVQRLLDGELSSSFSYEHGSRRISMSDFEYGGGYGSDCGGSGSPLYNSRKRKAPTGARRPEGISTQDLKIKCGEIGLIKSGNRFDLVLRLLQSETSAQTGVEPKKAKGSVVDPETGKLKPKPRSKSMKLPDPAKLGERVRKKSFPSESVTNKWSNFKSKYHLSDVLGLALKIMRDEIDAKKLFERGEEELAWEVVKEVTRWWLYGGNICPGGYSECVRGMGYVSWEMGGEFCPKLVEYVKLTTDKSKLVDWNVLPILEDIPSYMSAYGLGDGAKTFFDEIEKILPSYSDDDI